MQKGRGHRQELYGKKTCGDSSEGAVDEMKCMGGGQSRFTVQKQSLFLYYYVLIIVLFSIETTAKLLLSLTLRNTQPGTED